MTQAELSTPKKTPAQTRRETRALHSLINIQKIVQNGYFLKYSEDASPDIISLPFQTQTNFLSSSFLLYINIVLVYFNCVVQLMIVWPKGWI